MGNAHAPAVVEVPMMDIALALISGVLSLLSLSGEKRHWLQQGATVHSEE